MIAFKAYLQQQGYAAKTCSIYDGALQHYLDWLESYSIQANEVQYKDMLYYLEYCSKEGVSQAKQRTQLTIIRHYYQYLISSEKAEYNPAVKLFIKRKRRLPHGLLAKEELEQLYQQYQGDLQSKVVVGLLVYQGVQKRELEALKATHVQLKEGKIFIPSTGKTNNRWLKLEACQILELHELLKEREGKLFYGLSGGNNLSLYLHKLYQQLRKINPAVKDGKQIRQSVITYWLKGEDVRIVQEKAGHRFVSSTERYEQTNLEDLQAQLEKHHPLG
jgi:integrase/recombinase XerD